MNSKLVQIKTTELGILRINGVVRNITNHLYPTIDKDALVYIDTTEILSLDDTNILIDKERFVHQVFGMVLEGKDYEEETLMTIVREHDSATAIYTDNNTNVYRVLYIEDIVEKKDIYLFAFDYKVNTLTIITKNKGVLRTIEFENRLSRTHIDNSLEALKPITMNGEKLNLFLGVHKIDHYELLIPYNRFERRNYFKNITVETHKASNPFFQKYKYYIEED